MSQGGGWIRVRGARTHNLHNVNVDLPLGRLSVITGPSGSGKSSLAFDTLHAEAQRRYLETLGTDTRALFEQLRRPDVDAIDGLPPTLCVAQHLGPPRPRSTLATITEIHDHCRLLWARLGVPHCPNCGLEVYKHSVAEIVRQTLQSPEGRKIYLLAPLARDEAGDHKEAFAEIRRGGFLRARVDGVLHEVRGDLRLNPRQKHTIEVVVDRLVVRPNLGERLTESLNTTLKQGQGRVIVTDAEDGDWHDHFYTTVLECPRCRTRLPELEPRLFSFNNPQGACPRCTGYGQVLEKDTAAALERLEADPDADDDDEALDTFSGFQPCPECGGARLNKAARAVRFVDKSLPQVTALAVDEACAIFRTRPDQELPAAGMARVREILVREISHRLHFLQEVGLGYLTLDRPGPTLSGGELQRARLATHLGGGLLGVCYILDEPTIGLHPRDTDRLLAALRGLQERGNTVIVVEHDEAVMRQADYLVDIGPGAGRGGGRLLAAGTVGEVLAEPASVTASYLRKRRPPLEREPRKSVAATIAIRGARHHNLKNIDVTIPLGMLVCLTGVSGSGKSSLARDILSFAARQHLGLTAPPPGAHERIDGLEQIDKVIEVDQKRLGRSSRSNPASYTGVYDEIRKLFATTRMAKVRGYKANRFSFNVRGGRCEECRGQGSRRVALNFLPDLSVPCAACQGKRFNGATLAVRYRDRSIADVLDMPIAEARDFFANIPPIRKVLDALVDVGLGYLCLGQPSNTLSGGEAQRVKLATELAKTATGRTLFLLDEPTTGLHFADVANLIAVLRKLVERGNTLLVIEHHLDLIAASDWVIDLGPEGGAAGGHLIVAGPPQEVAACEESITGRFLRRLLRQAQ